MIITTPFTTSGPTLRAVPGQVAEGPTALSVTPALTMLEGPAPGQCFRMDEPGKRAYVAGRGEDADFQVPETTVSRHHSRLYVHCKEEIEEVRIEDLGSTNGTFVNGRRIRSSSLAPGDRVTLGGVILRFDLLDPVEVRAAVKLEERTRLAEVDSLTGLGTRRALGNLVPALDASSQAWSLLMIDLDHFKSINDRFGHQAGDSVLSLSSQALLASLRGEDMAVRWGGEEFLAVLPEAAAEAARAAAERVRRAISEKDHSRVAVGLRVTASIGVATRRPGESFEQVVARADAAAYEAKAAGRNTVRCSEK